MSKQRQMQVISAGQPPRVAAVDGSEASQAAARRQAVKRFLATGDEAVLRAFRGVTAAGAKLETGPAALEALALDGLPGFEDDEDAGGGV